MFIITTTLPLPASFTIMSLFFLKMFGLIFKFSSEKLCFRKNLITDLKVLFQFLREEVDLFFFKPERSQVYLIQRYLKIILQI